MNDKKNKIGIVCCSNGQKTSYADKIKMLGDILMGINLQPVFSDYIYESESIFSGTSEERANALMELYRNEDITHICDISGGDVANGILSYLDYDFIAGSDKVFWGYSDLTTVINAIYARTGKESVLYQIRNMLYDYGEQQVRDFSNTVVGQKNDLFEISYNFIQGNQMCGIVVGGNIRCFLKLAGTEYMPDLQDKILLLEWREKDVIQP